MEKKPIWTYHGDIAIAMEYALPYLERAKDEAEKNGNKVIYDDLFEMVCKAELIRHVTSQENRRLIDYDSLNTTIINEEK